MISIFIKQRTHDMHVTEVQALDIPEFSTRGVFIQGTKNHKYFFPYRNILAIEWHKMSDEEVTRWELDNE